MVATTATTKQTTTYGRARSRIRMTKTPPCTPANLLLLTRPGEWCLRTPVRACTTDLQRLTTRPRPWDRRSMTSTPGVHPGPLVTTIPGDMARAIVEQARAEDPLEACGIIIGSAPASAGGVPLR